LAGWTFLAPEGTRITDATLDRDLYKRNDNAWQLFVADQSGNQIAGQDCTIQPGEYQCEVFGVLHLTALGASSLSIGVRCVPGCVAGFSAHDVRADLDHAVVTISDSTPPSAPTLAGPLAQPSWHSGSVPLAVSSADTVGISQIQALGPAGNILATTSQPCDYTYATPCPDASAVSLTVDTRRLPDGIDPLTVAVTDPAQNTAVKTIAVMVANANPPPPVLTGVPPNPTSQPSARITARIPSTPVPITALRWMLCAASCGPAQTVAASAGSATATFTVDVPADGAYTIAAYALDAAGHRSAAVAAPFVLDRASADVSLPSGSGAATALAPVVGRAGVGLSLRLRRRAHGRLELDIRTRPHRAGRLRIRMTFPGHPTDRRTLALHHGAAVAVVRVPAGARRLTVVVAGLGVRATRHIRLAAGHT
jgi:hypothetical protein